MISSRFIGVVSGASQIASTVKIVAILGTVLGAALSLTWVVHKISAGGAAEATEAYREDAQKESKRTFKKLQDNARVIQAARDVGNKKIQKLQRRVDLLQATQKRGAPCAPGCTWPKREK